MEPTLEGNPLDSEPEAGTSNILKSLWFPPSTIPTQKSGQIVYGCAFLLGEQLDLTLVVFWNWQDRLGAYILSVEESWRYDGPSWGGRFREGYDPSSWSIWLLELKLFSSTLSSPDAHPEPDPGPVAQPGVLWRSRAHNSGCAAAAAHHWGHGHHLEAAPGPHSSYVQGKVTLCAQSVYLEWMKSACFEI